MQVVQLKRMSNELSRRLRLVVLLSLSALHSARPNRFAARSFFFFSSDSHHSCLALQWRQANGMEKEKFGYKT